MRTRALVTGVGGFNGHLLVGWEPSASLEEGLALAYAWIADQVRAAQRPAIVRSV